MILRSNQNEEIQNSIIQKFLDETGLIPNKEDEIKREEIILEIKKLISKFVKTQEIKDEELEKEFLILPTGSYALGVYQNNSDLDLYFYFK